MLRRPSVENIEISSIENNKNNDSVEMKASSGQEIENESIEQCNLTHDNINPKIKNKDYSPQNEISKSEKSELIKPTRTYVQSSSSSSARTITRTYEPLSSIPTANTGPTHSGHHTRQLVYLPSEL